MEWNCLGRDLAWGEPFKAVRISPRGESIVAVAEILTRWRKKWRGVKKGEAMAQRVTLAENSFREVQTGN